ncbi:MAG: hypothetical protein AAF585_13945 [Verrucomicrobiota bacterium]
MFNFDIAAGGFMALIAVGISLLTIVVQVILAVMVYNDATALESKQTKPFLMNSLLWGALTLITGIAGAAFYWASNRSTLAKLEASP